MYREERMPVYITPSAVIKWINGVDAGSAQAEIGTVTPHRGSVAKHDDGAYFLRHVLKNTNVNDRTTAQPGAGLLPQNSRLNPTFGEKSNTGALLFFEQGYCGFACQSLYPINHRP